MLISLENLIDFAPKNSFIGSYSEFSLKPQTDDEKKHFTALFTSRVRWNALIIKNFGR